MNNKEIEELKRMNYKYGQLSNKYKDLKKVIEHKEEEIKEIEEELIKKFHGTHHCEKGKCKCYNKEIPYVNSYWIHKEDFKQIFAKHKEVKE